MKELKNIPVIGPFLASLTTLTLIETAAFLLGAAFVAYNPAFPPELREEFIIPLLAGAFASATGLKGVLLAFAKRHTDFVVNTVNEGINALEKTFGRNFINDQFQAWLMGNLREQITRAAPNRETEIKLQRLVTQIGDLFDQIKQILRE